jgi:hypothetical protein
MLTTFAQEYNDLSPDEQAHFAEAVRRLLADGLIWREEPRDQRIYTFLMRRRNLVADYLQVAGWEVRHDDRIAVFQVVHRDGAHRHRLTRHTTIWLLLLRLLYSEKRVQMHESLTRYPVVPIGEVSQRYTALFTQPERSPEHLHHTASLDEALTTLQHLKLIRAGGGGELWSGNRDQLIELLPTLEMVIPDHQIAALNERLPALAGREA